ncbi:MAG: hypothetical protein ACOX20_11060 [Limnochordia bacterium]|jgi:hypothetical protein
MSRLDYGTIHRHLQDLERSLAALEQMRKKTLADFKKDIIRSWDLERRCPMNIGG